MSYPFTWSASLSGTVVLNPFSSSGLMSRETGKAELSDLVSWLLFFEAYRKLPIVITFLRLSSLCCFYYGLSRMVVAQDMLLSFARKSPLYSLVTQPFNINISFSYSIGIGIAVLILINYNPPPRILSPSNFWTVLEYRICAFSSAVP